MMKVVVICDRHRAPALNAFSSCFDVVGIVGTARTLPGAARITTLQQAMPAGVEAVIALTPSTKLGEWEAACRAQQIPLVSAGPISSGDGSAYAPGRWRHSAALRHILDAAGSADVGKPVFLRHSCCADGLHGVWWSLLDSLDFARHVLGQARRLFVGVSKQRSRWHAALSMTTVDGQTAHLHTAPAPHPGSDAMLLTSGGLAWSEASADSLQGMDGDAIRLNDEWPDLQWAQHSLRQDGPHGDESPLARSLLTVLRRASRSGGIETLEL